MLKLNSDKTEILILGTPLVCSKLDVSSINVGGCLVKVDNPPISNLGVTIDPTLSLYPQKAKTLSDC